MGSRPSYRLLFSDTDEEQSDTGATTLLTKDDLHDDCILVDCDLHAFIVRVVLASKFADQCRGVRVLMGRMSLGSC